MGRCKVCGSSTKQNYPLCWQHYYFHIKSFRFWFAFVLTIIWEYLINSPIITNDGFMPILLNNLFEATNFVWSLVGSAISQILVFVGSLMFMNYLVYKYFYSKKAIIKLPE